ncbi:MAG: hypothetical protein HY298_21270 [Verrucomicrobia bacterium]|nr:hypothetical protein [Verrucomicrobiota bacterium]
MDLAVTSLDNFIFGHASKPVTCGRGVTIGAGVVIPEINFTLPPFFPWRGSQELF